MSWNPPEMADKEYGMTSLSLWKDQNKAMQRQKNKIIVKIRNTKTGKETNRKRREVETILTPNFPHPPQSIEEKLRGEKPTVVDK